VRELSHVVVIVLRMWLFCWFGSNLTDKVSDFFERPFLLHLTCLSTGCKFNVSNNSYFNYCFPSSSSHLSAIRM
jgi:hypothetical protein